MIPLDVLRRVTVVYTHKNCPDGMASAMILKDAFRMLGTNPRIEFLSHGTKQHGLAGMEELALFCDISPTLECADVFGGCGTVIVLDHHKGAEEIVRAFGELGVFANEKLDPGVSGAVLAFRQVWLPARTLTEPRPLHDVDEVKDFAEYVGARDTWQTEDPVRFQRGQWISKMLMAKPAAYWLDEDGKGRPLLPYLNGAEVEGGRCLFEAHEEAVRQAVDQCTIFDVPGTDRYEDGSVAEGVTLYVFQEQASGFRLCSDVAEAIRAKPYSARAIVAGFSYVLDEPGGDPKLVYSLRGIGGFNVASFAKSNGGGGHTAASGFSVDLNHVRGDPYYELCNRLRGYLKRPEPRQRGQEDCVQDACENSPFACVGGLEARAELRKPKWIFDDEWEAYRAGYEEQAEKAYGPDWRTCEFSWKPALTIEPKP